MKKGLRVLVIIIILFTLSAPHVCVADDEIEEYSSFEINPDDEDAGSGVKPPELHAAAAIAIDSVTGRVLFHKNAFSRRNIASTTKIMTAIVAIEYGNLDDMVTVSARAAAIGGSVINLRKDEKIKLRDLLYGLMLSSGNDAAIAIAENIGGSVENFAEMMNMKAKAIGAKHTSFRTPHGLDRAEHFSTAYDLALITRYAMKNPVFARIVRTQSASISGNRYLGNTNELLRMYSGTDGVKTGYTGMAGRCLVASATRNNWRVISVVLGCWSRSARASDSRKILDYAFSNYKMHTLASAGEKIGSIHLIKGMEDRAPIETLGDVILPLRQDELDRIDTKYDVAGWMEAPVTAGDRAGRIVFLLDGKKIGQTDMLISKTILRKNFIYYLNEILRNWSNVFRF